MTTKTNPYGWMLILLSALFLISGLTACDSTEGTVESEPNKPKPEVPVADSDWQVVPATGGAITKDDITIDFPSGSFPEDTKVAITEVKKGEVAGIYEVSKFYQVTMPNSLNRFITFSIKNSNKSDDVSLVAHSSGFCKSSLKEETIETQFETSYSNGEYTSTIAVFDNHEEVENVFFTIGLAHIPTLSNNDASRTRGVKDNLKEAVEFTKEISFNILNNFNKNTLIEKTINNLTYKIVIPLDTWMRYDYSTLVKLEMASKKVSNYVDQALNAIFGLGFVLPGENRTLTISYRKGENWGGFSHSWINNNWSTMTLGIEKLLNKDTTDEDIKCTIIHELFHFIQSGYDPRCTFKKGAIFGIDRTEELAFCEMGAVWIEHLMNNGELNASFLKQEFVNPITFDEMGLTDILNRWTNKSKSERAQSHGYTIAPLLYYLCTSNEMKTFKFKNESVVELHDIWKKSFSSTELFTTIKPTLAVLSDWAEHYHNSFFFSGDQIDDYYLKFFMGQLVKNINIGDLRKNDKTVSTEFSLPFEGICFPFGCAVRRICLKGYDSLLLNNYNLIIRQETKEMQTYLLTTGKDSEFKKFKGVSRSAKVGDSIVIAGSTLESMRQKDGSINQYFFLVTTRTTNSTSDSGSKPWKLTVELKGQDVSVEPAKLEFPAKGDTKKVMINYGTYKYFGYKIENKDTTWIKAVTDKTDGVGVKFTVSPNTTTSPRETTVYCFVANVKESTDSNRVYMPVKITQKAGTAPSVTPEKLTFEASGGTQSVKVTAQGYTKFGYNIPQEYTSWLKGKAISGGTVEITAQPNDTGKERTATIKCFVTNVDNATDDQKVFMPVTIVQKAKSQPSTFKIETISLYFDYNDGVTEWAPYKSGKNWNGNNIAISGGHVTCSWKSTTNNSYSELSFDIDDVNKLESKAARISNIKGEGKTYYDDGRLVDLWKISADCQTTNSSSSDDDFTYYTWSWGKNSFYEFSGGGVAWVATVEHPTVLSKMVDAYGSISIKIAK